MQILDKPYASILDIVAMPKYTFYTLEWNVNHNAHIVPKKERPSMSQLANLSYLKSRCVIFLHLLITFLISPMLTQLLILTSLVDLITDAVTGGLSYGCSLEHAFSCLSNHSVFSWSCFSTFFISSGSKCSYFSSCKPQKVLWCFYSVTLNFNL